MIPAVVTPVAAPSTPLPISEPANLGATTPPTPKNTPPTAPPIAPEIAADLVLSRLHSVRSPLRIWMVWTAASRPRLSATPAATEMTRRRRIIRTATRAEVIAAGMTSGAKKAHCAI